ncbi:MAG: cytochrome c biogenesis protein CcsA [Bacillota bacterium]|nr:cytochrome c biogenesis protein CcsA [Bacillota bacterium]
MDSSLLRTELLLHWIAVGFYALSAVLFFVAFVFGKQRLLRPAFALALAGLAFHTGALGLRWLAAGRVPSYGRYETFSSLVWVAVAVFALLRIVRPELEVLGALVMPVAFLVIGFAVMASPELQATPRSFATYWLVIHVLFAKLTFGTMLLGTGLAWLGVGRARRLSQPRATNVAASGWDRLPSAATLDELSYRFIGLGFLALAVMLISGSIWANAAWGSYWGWEPVETWSLIAWLVYGVYLHLRRTYGWRGQRAAWVALAGFALFLFALWGLGSVFENQHSRYFE